MAGSNGASTYEQVQSQEQANEAARLNDAQARRVNLTNSNALTQTQINVAASIEPLDVNDLKLYGRGRKIPAIERQDVVDGVNSLPEPYNSEVTAFLKSNDVRGLQKYLNSKIDSGDIDVAKLKASLKAKGIWLQNGKHILVDNKFGPQTLETLKFLIEEKGEQEPTPTPTPTQRPPQPTPTDPEPTTPERKETWSASWIIEQMEDQITEIKNHRPDLNHSDERDSGSEEYEYTYQNGNFAVDKKRHTIGIATRGTKERSTCQEAMVNVNNRCEIDWKTGQMYAYCYGDQYELPFNVGPFKLDKDGYPVQDSRNNARISCFARIGNLMNMLKNRYVFNGKYSLEAENQGGIEVNDGNFYDTEVVSKQALDNLQNKYYHLGVYPAEKETRVKLASLLTAMAYDLGKIDWDDDVEDDLNKDAVSRVRYYSKRR